MGCTPSSQQEQFVQSSFAPQIRPIDLGPGDYYGVRRHSKGYVDSTRRNSDKLMSVLGDTGKQWSYR